MTKTKMKSWDELREIRDKARENTDLRTTGDNPARTVLAVGMATCGIASGARKTMETLFDEVQKEKLDNVSVISTGCLGYCYAEPMVEVREPGKPTVRYGYVDERTARDIIRKHVMEGILLDNAIIGQEAGIP